MNHLANLAERSGQENLPARFQNPNQLSNCLAVGTCIIRPRGIDRGPEVFDPNMFHRRNDKDSVKERIRETCLPYVRLDEREIRHFHRIVFDVYAVGLVAQGSQYRRKVGTSTADVEDQPALGKV